VLFGTCELGPKPKLFLVLFDAISDTFFYEAIK